MDESLIEQYKQEMLRMYRGRGATVNSVPVSQAVSQMRETLPQAPLVTEENVNAEPSIPPDANQGSDTGRLIAIVTTVRSLYPVPNARVTVFTGALDNMEVLATDFTDESGRTDVFLLGTPSKALSLDSANQTRPYALYNMMVEADGYVTNIHLNIPVFSGVTSLQGSNMMLLETAGADKGPRIFDELQNYTL